MRILAITIAAAFMALPASVPALAGGTAGSHSANAATVDYSAAKKKKQAQMKKEKVEYMRAAPMK